MTAVTLLFASLRSAAHVADSLARLASFAYCHMWLLPSSARHGGCKKDATAAPLALSLDRERDLEGQGEGSGRAGRGIWKWTRTRRRNQENHKLYARFAPLGFYLQDAGILREARGE